MRSKWIVPLLLIGLVTGCSTTEPDPILDTVYEQSQSGAEVTVGTFVIDEPGSGIWDRPDGQLLGRIEPGEVEILQGLLSDH